MRLLVFGTSNSILKNGYVDALRNHPDVSRLERIGPGGSTSVMLPYVGADVIFSEYDYVVLDASVNDGAFLEWGLLRPDEIRENLLWVCKAALRAGCVPVFLCMPNRLHLDVGDQALGVYRAVADAVGLALVDGYAFVRATAETDGVPAADLFKDDLHLLPEVSARLAPRIIAACRPATGASAAAAALGPSVRFRLIRAADLDLPISKRSTSLMEVDGVKIVVGQKLALQLNEGEQLCGAAYNAGHTFGSLIVAGNTKVAVNVRSHYFRKHDLVATVRQVSPAVAPQDGVVEVFLQKAEDVTAELLGFVVRCEGGDQAKDPSAVPTPPELTFPPQEAAAITELYAKAGVILEYGSGGSTVLAARQAGTTTFSVESDAQWAMDLQAALDAMDHAGTVHLHPVDVGPTGPWGRPTDRQRWRSFIHYPTSVWERADLLPPDLVLVDGRFRVGCFVATLMNITRPTTVLFDDYRDRDHYRVVEELLRPVRLIGRMAVFEAEPHALTPHDLRRFGAYFFDPD